MNKKALTVTANSSSKTYGTLLAFAGTEFTTSGLVNADTVTSVTLTSAGAAAAAAAGSYPIVPSAAAGAGLANYTITYVNGTLTVNTKALTVTANSTSKNYGTLLTFAGTEFTTSGLVNADTVTSVTLTSAGAAAAAAAGSYSIVPSAAVGSGLANYTITYVNGTLTVNNLGPTTTSISPTSKNVGDTIFTMTVNGTNFVSTSQVQLGGANRATTYVSATQLTVTILTADMTTAATYNVTVVNPVPGGGTSNAQTFTVNNLVPTTTSIAPSGKYVGDAAFTMTVNGTNFVTTSVVYFAGSARTTTYVNATQLTATIPATDMAAAGSFNITVANPAPGGGTSNAQVFTVTVPVSNFNAFETATAAAAITGVIQTKIAGSAFSLDVVAISGGAQSAGFTNAVKVELLGNTVTGIALDAQNCPTSSTLLQTVAPNPTITTGRSTVSFAAVADAWKDVRVRVSYPAAAPTVISCSTDNFAIRPDSLSVSVTDSNWVTAGTTRTLNNSGAAGGNVHKAGQPFTIQATAYNLAAAITGNYDGSPAAQPIACTLPIPTCINGTLTPGAWSAAGGTVTSTTATYSEAGSFNLTLRDTSFASVDNGDGTAADCTGYYICASALSVGRFVPDHFAVTTNNVPQLITFNDTACATRSFTYIGQMFGYDTAPQIMVTAQNASNVTTANYTSNLWKLATAVGAQDCTTNPDICTLASGSVTQTYTYTTAPAATPNWDSTQVALGTPTIAAGTIALGTNGTGTVTGDANDLLAFKRSTTTPQALFTASITLTDSVKDTSEYTAGVGNCGVGGAGGCDITTSASAAFSPIAFDSGNEFRYGRLKLSNALGSELLGLPIPIQAQYWNGTAFVTNSSDSCTSLITGNINLTAVAGVGATMPAGGTFISGVGSLTLTKPAVPAKVAVNVCVDLGADPGGGTVCAATTSASMPYLQGLWAPGSSYNNDPTVRATFGVYKGANELIYMRENY